MGGAPASGEEKECLLGLLASGALPDAFFARFFFALAGAEDDEPTEPREGHAGSGTADGDDKEEGQAGSFADMWGSG